MSLVWIALGLALLWWGGEMLVKHASDLARSLGMSPTLIGLTIVAFATSAPELAATSVAALSGVTDLAIGNVLGSNAANLGLVLGVAALVAPIKVDPRLVRRDIPVALLSTVALFQFVRNDWLGRGEGALFFAALMGYISFLIWQETRRRAQRRPSSESPEVAQASAQESPAAENPGSEVPAPDDPAASTSILVSLLGVAAGVALLVIGAQALVHGAVDLAQSLGVPDRVIGLTVVAVGTSLPELASCIVAARRDQGDLVLGNLIGSNIFNLLSVLAITMLIRPFAVDAQSLGIDLWVNLGITLLAAALLLLRLNLRRYEGALFLTVWTVYILYLSQAS